LVTPASSVTLATPPTPGSAASAAAAPEPTFDEVARILYAGAENAGALAGTCPTSLPSEARIRCLFDERYRADPKAAKLANELFVRWRVVAGVEAGHTMDGGYRGMIRIEPSLPVGPERRHIEWLADAVRDFDVFFDELARYGASHGGSAKSGAIYRFKPITLRFMRSVAARTPSAYAADWTVAWNLAGSLNVSGEASRETLFHEVFHLNDATHGTPGSEWWSVAALGPTFDAIVAKCGTKIPCLAPYSPNETIVRGGTYYSFQPGNGVREYAAELALRYYREQRAVLRSLPAVKPFKCGPAENRRVWDSIREEFFSGVDAVPACP
jgi:hypothetical protein